LQNRKTDAALSADLCNEFESAALCFRTRQDALDYADHIVQEANWLASIYHFGRVLKNYREGNLGLCATIRIGIEARKYDLICLSVEGCAADGHRDFLSNGSRKTHFDLAEPNRNQPSVFRGVAELIDSPEGVISSFVSLQRSKNARISAGRSLRPPIR
jgi:hypothetical protein